MVRVLIVEDMPVLREHAGEVLAKVIPEDLEILEAPDGKSGVELAISSTPDLVVMDISMPELNGIKAASKSGKSEKMPEYFSGRNFIERPTYEAWAELCRTRRFMAI